MRFSHTFSAAILLELALGAVTPPSLVLHEKRDHVPAEWIKRSAAPRDLVAPIRIAISQRNAALGHDMLMDIADPDSANFGKLWTAQEIHDFFSPTHEAVSKVKTWLTSSGIDDSRLKVHGSRGHVNFHSTIEEMEKLFGAKYNLFENADTGDLTISCDQYHVPKEIQEHVDFVSPTIGFDVKSVPGLKKRSLDKRWRGQPHGPMPPFSKPMHWRPKDPDSIANCSGLVTPACIKALYGLPYDVEAVPGNDMGIYESGDTYDQADLNSFFTTYYPRIPNGTHPILDSIDGAVAPVNITEGGGESILDFSLAFPIVYPQHIQLYQTLDLYDADRTDGIFDPFLDALDASYCTYDGGDNKTVDPTFPSPGYPHPEQCGVFKATNVVSLSYALSEAFYSPAYEIRQCHEYMKLSMQGTSFFFASGDNGTVSRAGLSGCLSGETPRFNPNFPSTCPYVTTVGGTQVAAGNSPSQPEVAVYAVDGEGRIFTSGGGFSNVFAQPSWQKAAVAEFLTSSKNLPPAASFNASGRAFPDVSANSYPTAVILDGEPELSGGTSASTPIFASIIHLINGERIKRGKGPIGFLNPTLYKNPKAFTDITEGYNIGCNDGNTVEPAFYAKQGWDPVTGLGTPKYEALLKVFLDLP